MIKKIIRHRKNNLSSELNTELTAYPEKMQKILSSRGILAASDLEYSLKGLIPPSELLNVEKAANILFQSIKSNHSILVIGDFDADGATSSALMMKSLAQLGASKIDFLVPDRFKFGYGLSVKLVEKAAERNPDIIVTVDNGIANHAGVDRANQLGIKVIITDHHLAAETLPNAEVIVNPNQPDDSFPSKNLAGVGVAFYLMLALRAEMRKSNWFDEQNIKEPNLAEQLDLVALGTVADVVMLDKNNRILVEQGLRRIRQGHCSPGITALLEVAKRTPSKCQSTDLGFAVGPRLNAAGRLDDMQIGINCLLANNTADATSLANRLDGLNKQRREIEGDMLEQAKQDLEAYFSSEKAKILVNDEERPTTLCLFDAKWHQGVIGILASRVKDRINRPVIIFAKDDETSDFIKGSARSVKGVHIRDILALIDSRNPNMIDKFGGHAMAAGLTIKEKSFKEFAKLFHDYTLQQVNERLTGGISDNIDTDGGLALNDMSMNFAKQLKSVGPWGQGFPEPLFDDVFKVISQRVVGEKHLKLVLEKDGEMFDAINFFYDESIELKEDSKVTAIYKLDINEFRGNESLQLMLDQIELIN
ncbi:MAG: single-stranded-DNA-specific exonuclease [Polaribacter sp.]|jgi:single-stranded-DNA-specific exonuclease